MTLKEKLAKRKQLIEEARAINSAAELEKRSLTAEERQKFDELMDASDKIWGEYQTEYSEQQERNAAEERSQRLADAEKTFQSSGSRRTSPPPTDAEERHRQEELEYRSAFHSYLVDGLENMPVEEKRALSAGLGAEGGYLVPVEQAGNFIQAIDNQVWMRRLGTVLRVDNADSLGNPSLENDPSDADWTTELGTGTEDSTMSFGKRNLKPHPYAKRMKVSRTLLAKVKNSESLAMNRLSYKCGITEEKGFMTGSGAEQALGVFIASDNGIPTSRDFSSGNTSSSMTFTGLQGAFYALKQGYRKNASWVFHRDGIKQLRGLTFQIGSDQIGYVWEPSVKVGEQDTILGRPVLESEYAPNTFTSGLYVGLFGDFSYYYIADGQYLEFQRLNELYAETNQVGLIVRREVDGQPVLPEAFARVKLG